MRTGEILVEHAARRFRVYPRESRALKDLVVARSRVQGADVWALRDVSFAVEPGSAVGLVGRNGSGKTTLLRLLSGIIKPSAGRVAVGGRVGSLLELGAGFHLDLTGRENVYLNGSIHGLRRAAIREKMDEIVTFAGLEEFIDLPVRTYSSGMYMRLGFAIAAHIEADVLLLDEVFAVGDEAVPAQVLRQDLRVQGARRNDPLRLPRRRWRSSGSATGLCSCTRAPWRSTGRRRGDRRIPAPARRRERSGRAGRPAQGVGSGDARTRRADRLLGPDGDARTQLLAGEPFTIAAEVVAERSLAPPRRRPRTTRRRAASCSRRRGSTADLAWHRGPPLVPLRFAVERLPLADGRLHLRARPRRRRGGGSYHSARRRAALLRLPADGARGLVRLEGALVAAGDSRLRAELESRELAHVPRLARADGDRSGAPVQALHVRRGAAACRCVVHVPDVSSADRGHLLRPRPHVFYAEHTDARVGAALRGTHWFDLREWIRGRRYARRLASPTRLRLAAPRGVVSRASMPTVVVPFRRYRAEDVACRRSTARASATPGSLAMLGDVLAACVAVGPTSVVAATPSGRRCSRPAGAQSSPTPAEGRARPCGPALAADVGPRPVLVVNADVPCVEPARPAALSPRARRRRASRSSTRQTGRRTRSPSRRPAALRAGLRPRQCRAVSRARSRRRLERVDAPNLVDDVDTLDDLLTARARRPGPAHAARASPAVHGSRSLQ